MLDALLKFPRLAALHVGWLLFLVDLGIAAWLFFLFLALAIVHGRGRRRDEELRIAARKAEEECLKKLTQGPTPNRDAPASEPESSVPPSRARSLGSLFLFFLAILLLGNSTKNKN